MATSPFGVALVETSELSAYQRITRKPLHLRELGLSDRAGSYQFDWGVELFNLASTESANGTGSISFSLVASTIPEPSTGFLLTAGLVALGLWRRPGAVAR